jgi:hypothetical protein
LAELVPDNPRWPLQASRLLILSGKVGEGSSELDAALIRWPTDSSLRAFALISGFRSAEEIARRGSDDAFDIDALREQQLRRVLDKAPKETELRRPIVVDDKASDIIVARAPNTDTAVLVFTALTDVVSMPLPIFDRYLAAFGVTAIYLKDFQRLSYMKGIVSLHGDYGAAIQALREICGRLSARRLYTIGCSAGGLGSIRYGVELGAERVLSFCGQTHSARETLSQLEPGVAMIMRRMEARVSPEELDLRAFLGSRRYSSKIDLVYPEDAERDKAHALYLSGIAGVTLHPVAGCDDHELLRWLALHGDLSATLADLLGLRPVRVK